MCYITSVPAVVYFICVNLYQQELNKKVKSFLNETTAKNTNMLIKSFMELPINKIERLENVVDLIFEKVILLYYKV